MSHLVGGAVYLPSARQGRAAAGVDSFCAHLLAGMDARMKRDGVGGWEVMATKAGVRIEALELLWQQARLAAAVGLHIAVALEMVAGKIRALDDSEQDLWA